MRGAGQHLAIHAADRVEHQGSSPLLVLGRVAETDLVAVGGLVGHPASVLGGGEVILSFVAVLVGAAIGL